MISFIRAITLGGQWDSHRWVVGLGTGEDSLAQVVRVKAGLLGLSLEY